MSGDCERCEPHPLKDAPGWAVCPRCHTMFCYATHQAYDQEGRSVAWPKSASWWLDQRWQDNPS